ncbi:glycoside hydrolase family 2 [Georgenia sp. 311]|uniref:glycoside hydrolase family 2 protein n=1 Tax=Georgenia sp. 311 TaxID=2585134 RepID=UPI001112AB5A|nr:glycoside hydrolase family 2 TIM barrel-domain containing protein [Georgenia sp. 311]TNC20555.1 glycoside hydrolase family 2 [Georgenia sp. 311]
MTTAPTPSPVSHQDGTYPRPQLRRPEWADLCGTWDFAVARASRPGDVDFDRRITVPFPPESPASGVGETGYLGEVWYRRELTAEDLERAGLGTQGERLVLRLGAVDYQADVWLAGTYIGRHTGGQAPFGFDVTGAVAEAAGPLELVVRAVDDPHDVAQPRGKQDWQREPHVIWYHRTTGIWQPVWLEAVPAQHVAELAWEADVPGAAVVATVRLAERPTPGTTVTVRVEHDGELLAEHRVAALDQDVRVSVHLPRQANGQAYEDLLWSPERPTLLDTTVTVADDAGRAADVVASYVGLRSIGVAHGRLLLNDRPFHLRSVLEQGYWPGTHLAAPSADALREEVELIKALGFNSVRVHQKAEDPRFLFWADRLGITVWGETANAYAFSPRAVEQLTSEWVALVRRDLSHPCIVTWVPLNESWGVQHGAHDDAQQHYAVGLANLTRALDPTRPVVSNDGWEHTDSDILTIHDYSPTGAELRRRYGTAEAVRAELAGVGAAGRRLQLRADDGDKPVMLTEFGGVSFAARHDGDWGYSTASDAADYEARLRDLLDAVRDSALAGFCYTQLTDTGQETNGLLDEHRRPKLPRETLRSIITGE